MLHGHDCVHESESFECILGVAHLALEQVCEILFDVGPRERGTPEQHRVSLGESEAIELDEVVLHHQRGLHEQPGHADDIGVVFFGSVDDRLDRLLDADVDDRVAVVADDDVDEVLADVMHVAPHGCEHQGALAAVGVIGLLDVRLEVGDGGLHGLRCLQDEWQLHLARTEELTDGLHAGQEIIVDDLQGLLAP